MMHKRSQIKAGNKYQEVTSATLAQLCSGDRIACEAWVKAHYEKIYCYHIRLSQHPQTAEDLTQDTFRSAWKALPSFAGNASFNTWLHRIAYNVFISWNRRKKSRRCSPEDLICHEQTGRHQEQKNPLTRLMAAERAAELERMLWQLNEASRQVLVLHYMQGLSYREMAQIMDEPAGTIKWRTSQAIKQLRIRMNKETNHETTQR